MKVRAPGIQGCTPFRLAALTALALASTVLPVRAQLSAAGSTQTVASFIVRGVAVAHDPDHNRYLVVGAQNHLTGDLVDATGVPVPNIPQIVIKAHAATGKPFAAFPRAAYSSDIDNGQGGYLVVWAMEKTNGLNLHLRLISSSGSLLGTETVISSQTAWGDAMGAAIAYSPVSQVFLIAWKSLASFASVRIYVQRVGITGALVGSPVAVSSGFGCDPGVTWNSNRNEFGVSYSGENTTGSFMGFARVPASNPSGFTRQTFHTVGGGLVKSTDISFNPETDRYVLSWWDSLNKANIAELDQDGNVLGKGVASTSLGSYDSLSSAYNPLSETFLLAGLDANDDVGAVELNTHGFRISNPQTFIVTPSSLPARYNRVEASTTQPRWNNVISQGFAAIWNRVVTTATTGGGAAGSYPPPGGGSGGSGGGGDGSGGSGGTATCTTPRPVSNWVCVPPGNWVPPDHPAAGGGTPPPPAATVKITTPGPGSVGTSFAVTGWAIDPAGTNSVTGINAVFLYAYPGCVTCSKPISIGAATYGLFNAEGAAIDARFANSGYARPVTLATGVYDLVVFARKTLDNKWISKVVRITVTN